MTSPVALDGVCSAACSDGGPTQKLFDPLRTLSVEYPKAPRLVA